MNPILEALGDIGYALDTPGAYLRGALGGKFGERLSGEDLLGSYGVDAGPLGGMAAEMVLDPLTLLPPLYGAYRGVRALSHADDMAPLMRRLGEMTPAPRGLDVRLGELGAQVPPLDRLRAGYRDTVGAPSPISDAMGKFGADETGALGLKYDLASLADVGLSRSDPEWVNNRTFYHGNATPNLAGADLDPMRTNPENLYGRGVYATDSLPIAEGYARSAGGGTGVGGKFGGDSRLTEMEGHASSPSSLGFGPTLYESRSNFGNILDMDAKAPLDVSLLGDVIASLERYGQSDPMLARLKGWARSGGVGPPSSWFKPAMQVARRVTPRRTTTDPLIEALRGRGIDALTHTGGVTTRMPPHQVVIGLDPNAVLGAGPATPYEAWRQVAAEVSPLDRLRAGYRDTVGAPSPISDALGRFGGDESGVLDPEVLARRFFGGDRRAARVAAVQGPDYPGGADKLEDIMRGVDRDDRAKLDKLLADPGAAKFVAGEIPEGSWFKGAGAEGAAFESPYGSIIRTNFKPGDPIRRPDVGVMLQPFRSAYKGGYTVEHMPKLAETGSQMDDYMDVLGDVAQDVANPRDPRDVAALTRMFESRRNVRDAFDHLGDRVDARLKPLGVEADDWGPHNVGMTRAGDAAVFDPGVFAFDPESAKVGVTGPFRASEPADFRRGVRGAGARAGVPDYIRALLERDAADSLGAPGMGVAFPELAAVRPDADLMRRFGGMLGGEGNVHAPGWAAFRDTTDFGRPPEPAALAYARLVRDRSSGHQLLSFLRRGLPPGG